MNIIYNIATFLIIFNFIFSIIGVWLFFNNKTKTSIGFHILKILAPLCMINTSYSLFYPNKNLNININIGTILAIISTLLFFSCSYLNYKNKLSVCYSKELPEHLVKQGAYKYIRHPFYLSYILNYIAGFMISLNPLGMLSIFTMSILYFHAAKTEEIKFNKSNFSEEYKKYKESTGMFLPKIFFVTRK